MINKRINFGTFLLLLCLVCTQGVKSQEFDRITSIDKARQMAWIADNMVVGEIKGVIFEFHGLGSPDVRNETNASEEEKAWAQNGYLVIFPYYGPWSWMNRQARGMVDFLVETVYSEFKLKKDVPLLLYGGSMGGFSSILYSRYSKHPVSGVIANCPVTNIKYHFFERPDLPRTFRSAYWGYKESFSKIMTEHNPEDQVSAMPNIPYFIMHTTGDDAVNKTHHSDVFVKKMIETGHTKVIYKEIEGGHHCGPIPSDVEKEKQEFILSFLKK